MYSRKKNIQLFVYFLYWRLVMYQVYEIGFLWSEINIIWIECKLNKDFFLAKFTAFLMIFQSAVLAPLWKIIKMGISLAKNEEKSC